MNQTTQRASLVNHLKDWEWASNQYRAGRPIKDISDDIGVPRSQLFDYFSKNNVTRDLGAAIHRRTQLLLAEDGAPEDGLMPTSPEDIISINATLQAALIRDHRDDIRRFRRLALGLLRELEGITLYNDVFEDLGELLRKEDKDGVDKLNDAYKHVISLPERSNSIKKLAEVLKIVVALERQAFGMREDYEDSEIRKARVAHTTPVQAKTVDDFEAITRKFQQVLGHINQEITDAAITNHPHESGA